MANCEKLLQKAKNSPAGLQFVEVCKLAECHGFVLARIQGSHHIYKFPGRKETLNFQEDKNGKAKKYQVSQLLKNIDEITDKGGD